MAIEFSVPESRGKSILFGANVDVGHRNSLSLRERARVRGWNKEYHSFSPSS
jgi:hypothetical protein